MTQKMNKNSTLKRVGFIAVVGIILSFGLSLSGCSYIDEVEKYRAMYSTAQSEMLKYKRYWERSKSELSNVKKQLSEVEERLEMANFDKERLEKMLSRHKEGFKKMYD